MPGSLKYVFADDGLNFRKTKHAIKNQNNKESGTHNLTKQ
jgi:hypothetical protein